MATENSLVLVQAMLSLSVEDERKDQRLMAQLAIVERAMETRRAAAALLREGFFELLQAKAAMGGPKAISRTYYDSRMLASAHVRVEGGSNDEDGEGADPALPPASDDGSAPFHLVRTPQLIASPAPSSSDLSSLIKDRSGSVAAGNHTEGAGNNSSSTVLAATSVSSSTALADSASSSASSIKDPLKWFGVFTSPHLRKSQDNFAQALPLLIELANLQYNLQTQAAP